MGHWGGDEKRVRECSKKEGRTRAPLRRCSLLKLTLELSLSFFFAFSSLPPSPPCPLFPLWKGRAWLARDLRNKSFSELHQLWFVLLKERNMLQTIAFAAKREGATMPGKDRIRKVRKSMAAIKVVLGERVGYFFLARNLRRKGEKERRRRSETA